MSTIAKQVLDICKLATTKGECTRLEKVTEMKVKASKKPPKIRPQDGVLFVPSRLEPDPCPKCKNMSLMTLEDLAFIKKKNNIIKTNNKSKRDLFEACGRIGEKTTTRGRLNKQLVVLHT